MEIENICKVDFSGFTISEEIVNNIIEVYKVELKGITNELYVGLVDIANNNVTSGGVCSSCLFGKFSGSLEINIGEEDFSCNAFCYNMEKLLSEKMGLINSKIIKETIIFLEKTSSKIIPEIISINFATTAFDIRDLKENVCSINCCGDLEPKEFLRKGCWTKKENCCPLKLLLNKKLKTHG